MSNIGSLEIDLLLESSSFLAGMKKAQEATKESAASIKESLDFAKEAVIGLAEAFAVDFIVEKINSALEYAESIKKVAEQTGLTTTAIQGFNYAASQSGVATDVSNAALERFVKSLGSAANGNQKALSVFKALGVTSTDANVALGQFADGLAKVPTTAQKAADVTAVFGRNAQGLTELLSDGKKGLDEYTASAQELGIVLDGNVINGAAEAEHKISALKMVITAEWANIIDKNANSIAALAQAMIELTSAVAGFVSAHPEIALGMMGAMAGGAVGGLPGAAIGGLAGVGLGYKMDQNMSDGNMDVNYRYQQVTAAQNELKSALAKRNDSSPGAFSDPDGVHGLDTGAAHDAALQANTAAIMAADANYKKQLGLYAQARHPVKETEGGHGGGVLPPLKQPKAPRGHSADQTAAFDKALGALDLQTYSLKGQLSTDPREKAMYEHDAIDYDYGTINPDTGANNRDGQLDKEVDDQLAAGKFGDKSSDLAKARAEELKQQNDINGALKSALVNRTLDAALDAQALAEKQADLTNQEDILKGSLDLARTSAEKKQINDQLIDLQNQQVQAQLEAVLTSKDSTDAEKKIAAARLALLPQLEAQAKAKNAQDNSGPIAAYLNAMPKTVGEIGDSLQTAAVQGLGSLTDGIAAAINGTGSLKSAFSNMAMSIVTDLEKIVIEEEIVKPLANLLTGGSGGGGGLLGSLAKGIGGALFGGIDPSSLSEPALDIGGAFPTSMAVSNIDLSGSLAGFRANGGMTAPGDYMVGERGPEVVSIGAPSNVTPTRALNGLNGGGGRSTTINSTVNGVNDPALVRQLAAQTIFQAMPAQLRMSSDNTIKRLNRPTMR